MDERYNFFDAFNGFGAWLRNHKIPSSAILLYYALLQISNSAGRKNPLNVPIKLLMEQTGLTAPTIRAARMQLKEKGLIDVVKTSDGKAPNYTIFSVPDPENSFRGSTPDPENSFRGSTPDPENSFRGSTPDPENSFRGSTPDPENSFRGSTPDPENSFRGSTPDPENSFPILRVNNNRVNNNREKERKDSFNDSQIEAVTIFENQIHPISSISEKENVISLIEEYGAEDFISATKEAVKRNARTIHYISAILRNWKEEGKNGNQRANVGVPKIKLSDDISEAVERKRQRILREILPQYARGDSGKASDMP
ncbi:DnaD domain protein [Acidaminococcus intestini]|uniref:DnaD domain protein n=6 Tax=Acidaminococcus intestini TaxID=187327 RepID=UPI003A8A3A72